MNEMTHLKCLDGTHYMGRAQNSKLCYVSPALGPRGSPVCLEGLGWKRHVAGETQGPPGPRLRCGCTRSGDPEVLRLEGQPSFLSPGGRPGLTWKDSTTRLRGGPPWGESSSQARRAQSPNRKAGDGISVSQEGRTFPGVSWGPKEQTGGWESSVQGGVLLRKSLDVLSALPGTAPPKPTASSLEAENGDSAPP